MAGLLDLMLKRRMQRYADGGLASVGQQMLNAHADLAAQRSRQAAAVQGGALNAVPPPAPGLDPSNFAQPAGPGPTPASQEVNETGMGPRLLEAGGHDLMGGIDNALAATSAALGGEALAGAMHKSAAEHAERAEALTPDQPKSFTRDVHGVGDAAKFGASALVRGLPMLGAMGVGGALARSAGLPALAGVAAPSMALNTGAAYGETANAAGGNTPEAGQHALAAGAVGAAIDTLAFGYAAKLSPFAKGLLAKTVSSSLPGHILRSAAVEGLTGAGREAANRVAVNALLQHPDIFQLSPEDHAAIADAAATNIAATAPLGVAGHVGRGVANAVDTGLSLPGKAVQAFRPTPPPGDGEPFVEKPLAERVGAAVGAGVRKAAEAARAAPGAIREAGAGIAAGIRGAAENPTEAAGQAGEAVGGVVNAAQEAAKAFVPAAKEVRDAAMAGLKKALAPDEEGVQKSSYRDLTPAELVLRRSLINDHPGMGTREATLIARIFEPLAGDNRKFDAALNAPGVPEHLFDLTGKQPDEFKRYVQSELGHRTYDDMSEAPDKMAQHKNLDVGDSSVDGIKASDIGEHEADIADVADAEKSNDQLQEIETPGQALSKRHPGMSPEMFKSFLRQGTGEAGGNAWVNVTRTTRDPATGRVIGTSTNPYEVNFMNIARNWARQREAPEKAQLFGERTQARNDNNFADGIGALMGGWHETDEKGNPVEVRVDPAAGAEGGAKTLPEFGTDIQYGTGNRVSALKGWVRQNSVIGKAGGTSRSFGEAEQSARPTMAPDVPAAIDGYYRAAKAAAESGRDIDEAKRGAAGTVARMVGERVRDGLADLPPERTPGMKDNEFSQEEVIRAALDYASGEPLTRAVPSFLRMLPKEVLEHARPRLVSELSDIERRVVSPRLEGEQNTSVDNPNFRDLEAMKHEADQRERVTEDLSGQHINQGENIAAGAKARAEGLRRSPKAPESQPLVTPSPERAQVERNAALEEQGGLGEMFNKAEAPVPKVEGDTGTKPNEAPEPPKGFTAEQADLRTKALENLRKIYTKPDISETGKKLIAQVGSLVAKAPMSEREYKILTSTKLRPSDLAPMLRAKRSVHEPQEIGTHLPNEEAKPPKAEARPEAGEAGVQKSTFNPSKKETPLDSTDPKVQRDLIDAIQKITGKTIDVHFDPAQAHQGQYEAAKNMVTLAATSNFAQSNAFHEAFHAVAHHFLDGDQRRILYRAFRERSVKMQLRELLKDSPADWDAAKENANELAAYAFQFWHAGVLKMTPEYTSTIGKIFGYLKQKWDQVNNWLRMQDSAEEMMQKIKDGAFADGKANAVELALSKNPTVLRRVREITRTGFKLVDKLYDSALYPYDTRLRDMGNPAIDNIAKHYYTQVGETATRRGLVQEMPIMMAKHLNAFDQLQRDPAFAKTFDEMASGGDAAATDKVMAGKIRGFFDKMHDYQTKAGITMGKVPDYIPLTWDGEKVGNNKAQFIQMMQGHQGELDALNAELKNRSKDPSAFKPMTPESVWKIMKNRGLAVGEFIGDVFDEHGAPADDHTLDRVFSFLSNADRRPFAKDNVAGGVARYVRQAVRRAEWVRRFGEKSEVYDELMKEAKAYGLSPAEEDIIKNYREDAFGAKLHDMNPMMRKILAASTVYQNYRVLGLSVLGNMTDPFGVAIRSGEARDAWDSYKLAASRLTAKGRAKVADLQAMAETIGTIERTGVLDSLTGMYGGVNIEGHALKMNEMLFKYNGMAGLTRSVRLAALNTAINFIAKHSQHPEGVRHLAELGLQPADVHLNPNGGLKILESDGLTEPQATKIQAALNRFVDEAAMRPNVGERTKWGANPYFAPFWHLKQYIFTFNKVMNKKLEHELIEHDNVTPYMMASSYIPIMGGMSMFRDMLLNGGSVPAQNGFMHYMGSGMGRSGLFGPSDLMEAATVGTATGNINAMQQVAGPAASQIMDVAGALANAAGRHSFSHMVAESLPLGSVAQKFVH